MSKVPSLPAVPPLELMGESPMTGFRSFLLIATLAAVVYFLVDAEHALHFSGRKPSSTPGLVHISEGIYGSDGSNMASGASLTSSSSSSSSKAASMASSSSSSSSTSTFPTTESLLYEYLDHAGHLARLESMVAAQPSGFALLSAQAQRLIYEWQHPPSCFGRKYVVSQGNDPKAGIGSHIHIASHHFAVAMELGAVMVWADNVAGIYTDPDTCNGDFSAQNLECFFLPPSNCTLQDAFALDNTRVDLRFGDAGEAAGFGYKFFHVPHQFQDLWESAGLPTARSWNTGQQDHVKYWFRGQMAAYFMRPNAPTVAAFKALRTGGGAAAAGGSSTSTAAAAAAAAAPVGATTGSSTPPQVDPPPPSPPSPKLLTLGGTDSHPSLATTLATSFPLPPGVISLHIRHGDKGSEMALVPTSAYIQAASMMVKANPLAFARRALFLSTEDPSAIDETGAMIRDGEQGLTHWAFSWYDVPRANSNGPEQLSAFSLPRAVLTRIWLLQLLIALECDAWVGTRGSNWNRLIDELRCIWVPKCANDYSEVGDFTKWENYAWRRE